MIERTTTEVTTNESNVQMDEVIKQKVVVPIKVPKNPSFEEDGLEVIGTLRKNDINETIIASPAIPSVITIPTINLPITTEAKSKSTSYKGNTNAKVNKKSKAKLTTKLHSKSNSEEITKSKPSSVSNEKSKNKKVSSESNLFLFFNFNCFKVFSTKFFFYGIVNSN